MNPVIQKIKKIGKGKLGGITAAKKKPTRFRLTREGKARAKRIAYSQLMIELLGKTPKQVNQILTNKANFKKFVNIEMKKAFKDSKIPKKEYAPLGNMIRKSQIIGFGASIIPSVFVGAGLALAGGGLFGAAMGVSGSSMAGAGIGGAIGKKIVGKKSGGKKLVGKKLHPTQIRLMKKELEEFKKKEKRKLEKIMGRLS